MKFKEQITYAYIEKKNGLKGIFRFYLWDGKSQDEILAIITQWAKGAVDFNPKEDTIKIVNSITGIDLRGKTS